MSRASKINLLNFSRDRLREWFVNEGEAGFRAEQVMQWIYQAGVCSFTEMTNLSKVLRARLNQIAHLTVPVIAKEQLSTDGTIKWKLRLEDAHIETVYIPESARGTLCVSSQVGCPLACSFCATGRQGFFRNLKTAEILGQFLVAKARLSKLLPNKVHPITNVVFMGMGEPLLNLANVVPALKVLIDDFGPGLARRRVTVSTAGIVPGINRLAEEVDVALALSLHAPTETLRSQLMPVNMRYPLQKVLAAVKHYIARSKANQGQATIEYILLRGVNDAVEQADQLAEVLAGLPSKINLIPWNPNPHVAYQTSSAAQIQKFAQRLQARRFFTFVRKLRGEDIQAACGQLVGKLPIDPVPGLADSLSL